MSLWPHTANCLFWW